MRYLLIWLMPLLLLLGACTGGQTPPEETPDPVNLITDASENIRESETFRMEVIRTGAEYYVPTDLGNVDFRRAVAQYVAPDILQATVRVVAAGLPADVDVFSRGEDQWFRNTILTANNWLNTPFAEGFNPERLISENTGFQQALKSLINLSYVGLSTLEDGTAVHHLKGTARGEEITALMANLVEATGEVLVDVFIDQQQLIPVRFIIVQPDTITDEKPDPTTWTVDVYDINAAPDLDIPETS